MAKNGSISVVLSLNLLISIFLLNLLSDIFCEVFVQAKYVNLIIISSEAKPGTCLQRLANRIVPH